MAAQQRTADSVSSKNRASITDKNMIPFTAESTDVGGSRYTEPPLASHVIGYIAADGSGASGIEKGLDSEISGGGGYSPSLVDATGNTIPNFRAIDSYSKKSTFIKLTLDYHIQKITESVLDEENIKGAAVVMDIDTFDVLAMTSRPDYNRGSISEYIISGDTELLNRAVAPYNAGSIFKIVTAAAALEEGLVKDEYFCAGALKCDGIDFLCHKREGHGPLNFDGAFSASCNCAFYETGIALGSDKICDYAFSFGMGSRLLDGVITENCGNVPRHLAHSQSEAANLSIGQGEIMITPLQAAKIVCTVANGGISKHVNLVDSIVYADGSKIKNYRKKQEKRVISRETADRICDMMLTATEEGTGSNAMSETVKIAGKTGSAETGWHTEDGYMVQGWFIGFFPYESPKYALAVMSENGRGGNASCAPAFKKIAEKIVALKKS
ncbi:MAG: penicillin-binding protein 2 [Ruminococcaceae bacterium]|nr:penicillin-binding protein 2 [Oscillospiraceae bacterium]